MKKGLTMSKVFEDILYAQCWEDPQMDRAAFALGPEDAVFSITSGGCNVLSFLIDDPRKVIALDVNPCQNYLLDLKMAAFRMLDYDQLLEFVGVRKASSRALLYRQIRPALRVASRSYWDCQEEKIRRGIIHCGRYESYMRLVGKTVERLVGRKAIAGIFGADSPRSRAEIFHRHWDNRRWRLLTRVLLSRTTMAFLFDDAFFRYLDESFSFGRHFADIAERALIDLTPGESPFLSYILLGHYFNEEALPQYLRREHFGVIRDRVDRIVMVCEDCGSFFSRLAESSISRFNFSNIFEWMSGEAFEDLLRQTYRVATEGAVLTYRNLLVFRERPSSLSSSFQPLREEAARLHKCDLSFVYSRYVVEKVVKREVPWNTSSEKYTIAGQ